MKKPLQGKVGVVAGSARGAGRGIACMLGEAGATVYCTARSAEKLEETATMVTAHGGIGIAVRVDHTKPAEVEKLFARIAKEHGRVDVLVNNINADTLYQTKRSLDVPLETGLEILKTAIWSHIVNAHYALPLMKRGLIVEITDGDGFYYRGLLYYDLTKTNAIRLAMDFSAELRKKNIAAVAVTPGFLRSELVLESLHVTEENWRDAVPKRPEFAESETPYFIGRAIAGLAADKDVMKKSGRVFNSLELAREYGFTDVDGRMPDVWTWLANSKFHYRKIDDEFYSYFKIDYDAMAQ
ncbi:MAG TPA: SDR family NAD(P)-dependent oxidoreductase, partial [Thermoanaerobaculia bacterium]|nr:SDR family NAD(P)-dependent oxidoreductase [Thermoanaerobaculia bacterium]